MVMPEQGDVEQFELLSMLQHGASPHATIPLGYDGILWMTAVVLWKEFQSRKESADGFNAETLNSTNPAGKG
jgi:hypothetical protein